jgi:nucleotide-binding universal stress UspA family protein
MDYDGFAICAGPPVHCEELAVYKRILIPTDGSDLSNAAAHAAVAFAARLGSEAIGIFVAPPYTYPVYAETIPPDYLSEDEYNASMRKAGEVYLKEISDAAARAGVRFTGVAIVSDSPARQIVETAQQYGCDLIFIGSHGHSGLGQLLLGSVTSKVLATCRIPVLVYRATEDAGHTVSARQ